MLSHHHHHDHHHQLTSSPVSMWTPSPVPFSGGGPNSSFTRFSPVIDIAYHQQHQQHQKPPHPSKKVALFRPLWWTPITCFKSSHGLILVLSPVIAYNLYQVQSWPNTCIKSSHSLQLVSSRVMPVTCIRITSKDNTKGKNLFQSSLGL